MKAVIYAFNWRISGMMQIISDIYERIFPSLTAEPNVLVQFDCSTSAGLEEDREGGNPNSQNKSQKSSGNYRLLFWAYGEAVPETLFSMVPV